MTVKELIKELKKLPPDYKVMQESAPWGWVFETTEVCVEEKYDQSKKKWIPSGRKIVYIDHGVGF